MLFFDVGRGEREILREDGRQCESLYIKAVAVK
jgi:hypothetical protein